MNYKSAITTLLFTDYSRDPGLRGKGSHLGLRFELQGQAQEGWERVDGGFGDKRFYEESDNKSEREENNERKGEETKVTTKKKAKLSPQSPKSQISPHHKGCTSDKQHSCTTHQASCCSRVPSGPQITIS
jgi:hypothetical protein